MSLFRLSKVARNERAAHEAINHAFAKARNRDLLTPSDKRMLRKSRSSEMFAVNHYSRIHWAEILCSELSDRFSFNVRGFHGKRLFFCTLVDVSCIRDVDTSLDPLDLFEMKRYLRQALNGHDYIGVIEPAFYANLQEGCYTNMRCVSWHLHVLVWGISKNDADRLQSFHNASGRYRSLVPGVKPVHASLVYQGRLARTVRYMLKSPTVASRVTRYDHRRDGLLHVDHRGQLKPYFKQGQSAARPGERIRIFNVMKRLRLPDLSLSGGNGRALLRSAKRQART